jgi:hypothetical protein
MLSRFFQESDHLLALYAGESLEELLNRITSLQMIEQTLHRHASTSENRFAAKNFRILRYNAAHARQNTAWFWSPQNRCSSVPGLSTLNHQPSIISRLRCMHELNGCLPRRRSAKAGSHGAVRRPRRATYSDPASSQCGCARGVSEPALSLSNRSAAIETRSLPALARSYPRRFTFYLGNPFPRFLDSWFLD